MERPQDIAGVYYVVLRGFHERIIFKKENDYEQFLAIFERCKNCFMVFCHGYCLLPSGCHCVVKGDNTIVVQKAFKQTASMYSVYFCAREGRGQPVWEPTLEVASLDTDKRVVDCLKLLLSLSVWSGLVSSPSQYPYLYVDGSVDWMKVKSET